MRRKTKFTLCRCQLYRCGCTALMAVLGTSGYRLTDSSCGIWQDIASIEPGDPRYDECVRLLREETSPAIAEPYLKHLGRAPTQAQRDAWRQQTRGFSVFVFGSAVAARLQPHLGTLGEVSDNFSTLLTLPGVGRATRSKISNYFGRNRLRVEDLRQARV